MMTYPPTHIQTPNDTVNILQLTDLHLYLDTDKVLLNCNFYESFIRCLNQALNESIRCDLILVTGDLVNRMDSRIYDRIFGILQNTGINFACISGNHDVTEEIDDHLPFSERTFIAHEPDSRLLERHSIIIAGWQILLINSSNPGEVSGNIDLNTRRWLDETLSANTMPALIALHHPVIPLQSKWIDAHIAGQADLFWQTISKHPQVKGIVNGHAHQEHYLMQAGVASYTTPSTCYQFKAHCDEFTLDLEASPGYRWLQLGNRAKLESWVKRLDT